MNTIRIMTLRLIVAPYRAPQSHQGEVIVEFESEHTTQQIYSAICRRQSVRIEDFMIREYTEEGPSVLLSEHPIALLQEASGAWLISSSL